MSDSTRQGLKHTLGELIDLVRTDRKVATIIAVDVEDFLTAHESTVSESSLAKHYRHLKRFLRWCMARGYISHDPTVNVAVKPKSGVRT
ncbi:MAG: site-specific integrase, partial [Planctomycetes bacterium]|nr:site-specific integrase [Planctomycetota bacterium]